MQDDRSIRAVDGFNRFAEESGAPGRCGLGHSFEKPDLARFAALWRDKAAGQAMPRRRDMNAFALKTFLPQIAILDVVPAGDAPRFRFRLMGTSLSQILGDHTGRFIDEAIVPPYRERWSAAVAAALQAGCPIRLAGRVAYREDDYLAMEVCLAPFEPTGQSAAAVIVAAYTTFSARHVFDPLVRNTVSAETAA